MSYVRTFVHDMTPMTHCWGFWEVQKHSLTHCWGLCDV